jgi:hypothetical protein
MRPLQSNDELKKMLHEMQGQANQSGAVAALEMEVMDLLQKLDDATQRAVRGEERLAAVEQELSDYKELNDLLEADNAKYVTRLRLAFQDSLFAAARMAVPTNSRFMRPLSFSNRLHSAR